MIMVTEKIHQRLQYIADDKSLMHNPCISTQDVYNLTGAIWSFVTIILRNGEISTKTKS